MRHVRCAENDICETDEGHRQEYTEALGPSFRPELLEKRDLFGEKTPLPVDDKTCALNRAENCVVPAHAMPEPACHHRNHKIAPVQDGFAAGAAQWDIHIISKPERQRHVPAPPELGQVL